MRHTVQDTVPLQLPIYAPEVQQAQAPVPCAPARPCAGTVATFFLHHILPNTCQGSDLAYETSPVAICRELTRCWSGTPQG